MRILLQHADSGLYCKDAGAWARTSSEAKDFVSSSGAIDFCVANKLTGLQLVLKFEDQRYEIVVPITPLPELQGARASQQP